MKIHKLCLFRAALKVTTRESGDGVEAECAGQSHPHPAEKKID